MHIKKENGRLYCLKEVVRLEWVDCTEELRHKVAFKCDNIIFDGSLTYEKRAEMVNKILHDAKTAGIFPTVRVHTAESIKNTCTRFREFVLSL